MIAIKSKFYENENEVFDYRETFSHRSSINVDNRWIYIKKIPKTITGCYKTTKVTPWVNSARNSIWNKVNNSPSDFPTTD